jgi:hypothetical protein
MKRVMGVISIAVALVMASLIGVPTAQASVTATTIAVHAGNNQTAPPGTAVSTAPAVIVTGADRVPVAGVSVTFAVASGGGTLGSPATVTTGADGIATAPTWTLGATAGSNTLTATASGLTGSPVTFTAMGTLCTNSGGAGSEDNPFQIATAADLERITSYGECRALGLHYKQTADITLTNSSWHPIGDGGSTSFGGTFDGDGKSISGLRAISAGDAPLSYNRGLFGTTDGATLRNIRLINVNVTGEAYIGGLVGNAESTLIENCSVSGIVGSSTADPSAGIIVADHSVGGVVGWATNSVIRRTTSTATVSMKVDSPETISVAAFTGGIVGQSMNTIIEDSSASGIVTGSTFVGGIVGALLRGSVVGSTSSATVTGVGSVGGLVGHADVVESGGVEGPITVTRSHATGDVTAHRNVGGLIGSVYGHRSHASSISESSATGSVNLRAEGTFAGGLIGDLYGFVDVSKSFASVDIRVDRTERVEVIAGTPPQTIIHKARYVGALVGEASGDTATIGVPLVEDSYATGSLGLSAGSGGIEFGGVLAWSSGITVRRYFYSGIIDMPMFRGFQGVGVIIDSPPSVPLTVDGVFWNSQSSGISSAVLAPYYSLTGTATALNDGQMRYSTNFPGWDFSTVWGYDCSTSIYPQLRSINSSATATSCPEPPPSTGGGTSTTDPTPTPTPTPTSTSAATSEPAPTAPDLGNPRRVSGSQLAAIPPSQIGLIPAADFGRIPAAAFAALTPQQVAALTPGQVNAIRPARAAALTPAAVAAMSPGQLASLRPRSVGALKPAALAGLSGEQLSALRPAAIASIPPDVLARLSVEQLRALTPAQVRAMTPEQRAALSPRQRGALA